LALRASCRSAATVVIGQDEAGAKELGEEFVAELKAEVEKVRAKK
jgi:hypothetical protein